MKITSATYIPVVRWREAEYQALFKICDKCKDRIVPIIVVPPIEYDPEIGRPKKSVSEVISTFVKRVPVKWGNRPAWIDFDDTLRDQRMDNGTHVVSHVFEQLRVSNAHAVPVVWLDSSSITLRAVSQVNAKDGHGVGFRLKLENIMVPTAQKQMMSILKGLGIDINETDLLLDLGKTFEPYNDYSKALIAGLSSLTHLDQFRNFVIIGTSMPDSLSKFELPGDTIPRHEWLFYQELLKNLPSNFRRPNFGDYTIVPPSFSMDFNMAIIKPAARLVYANGKSWIIRKGTAFRDDPEQMINICADITNSSDFRGRTFSPGDEEIFLCANNERKNMSNLGGWKQFGISHHIMQVLDDLAIFDGNT